MKIPFYEYRKIYYMIPALLIALSLVSLFTRGLNQGIDFQSGTLMDLKFASEIVTMEEVRGVLAEYNMENSSITQDGEGTYVIKSIEISEEAQSLVLDSFRENLGEFDLKRIESVGPIVGRELTRNGIIALAAALLLMMAYISIRFQWRFAISAIVCLMHDAFLMLGFFSLFQFEVESSFIAAILTIVGYSINDTIVFFDRIRENLKLHPKWTGRELVNHSVNQTMMRAINLFITFALVLVAMIFLGGETTKVFAIALLVGNTAGFYSSAFIAANLWADLKPAGVKLD
jgi:preprotein translocase subunit SecF